MLTMRKWRLLIQGEQMHRVEFHQAPATGIWDAVKKTFYFRVVRWFARANTDFFKFNADDKTDYRIIGRHWSGIIIIHRRLTETRKAWLAFCIELIRASR